MKYELTDTSRMVKNMVNQEVKVFQIRSLQDFKNLHVKAGQLGGWVETADQLSQEGESWIYSDSVALDDSTVEGDAILIGKSILYRGSRAEGNACIEDSEIDYSVVKGNAHIKSSSVTGKSLLGGSALISNSSLCGVDMTKGKIVNSTVQSICKTNLVFEKDVNILDCKLTTVDNASCVKDDCRMELVEAENFKVFRLRGAICMKRAFFKGKTFLDVNEGFTLEGAPGGECTFDMADLVIQNSVITGNTFVTGYVRLFDSQLSDLASVQNDTENRLTLERVKLEELSGIHLPEPNKSTTITDKELNMDALWVI